MQALRLTLRAIQRARWTPVAAACLALASCGQIQLGANSTRAERIAVSQYQMLPAGRAWLYAPDGLLTLERDLGDIREQRIALTNETSFEGDNYLLLRTRNARRLTGGRLNLDAFLDETGGLPSPFEGVSEGSMQVGEDELGPYFYTTRSMGPGTVCVLAVRPIKATAHLLPDNADAMDVLLRNCTPDGEAAALAPIRSVQLGRAAGRTADGGATALHTMSPLAAPKAGGS